MPRGMWRRRPPLPPTPGTVVVCPIGECTPETAERYRRERDAAETGEPGMADMTGRIMDLDEARRYACAERSGPHAGQRALGLLEDRIAELERLQPVADVAKAIRDQLVDGGDLPTFDEIARRITRAQMFGDR
jgi:hypothetical protein